MNTVKTMYILTVILSLTLFGSAQAVVIDFDALAAGVAVTNQFPQATFSSDAGFENRTAADFNLGTSLPNYICTAVVNGGLTCVNSTIVDFAVPVQNLTFLAGGDDNAGITGKVDVYENNILTATVDIVTDASFFVPHLIDLSVYVNVTRIVIHSITDGGGLAFDDFSFDEDTVATEESTWGRIKELYQ